MVSRYTKKNLTWVDCIRPTPAEVRTLMQEFAIDPLIAEELLLPSFKPKVELRGQVLYVILHFPSMKSGTGQHRPEQEIDFLIGRDFLITTRYEATDPLHSFAKAFEPEAVLGTGSGSTHGGHLFISIARSLYAALSLECDVLERRLDDIEEHIFAGEEKRMVARLSQAGRLIHDFRQALLSHEDMLRSFEPYSVRFFGQEFSYYVRDLIGAYERVLRRLDNLRDSLSELRETNNSLLSTKQNEIMKTLTVLAFIFLPLTFIAGLFGMNTAHNPIVGSEYDFWIILAGMCFIALCCFAFFRHKDWL